MCSPCLRMSPVLSQHAKQPSSNSATARAEGTAVHQRAAGFQHDKRCFRLVPNYGSTARGWNIPLQFGTFRTLGTGKILPLQESRITPTGTCIVRIVSVLCPARRRQRSRRLRSGRRGEEKACLCTCKGTARGGALNASRFEVVGGEIRSAHRVTE